MVLDLTNATYEKDAKNKELVVTKSEGKRFRLEDIDENIARLTERLAFFKQLKKEYDKL